jgi:hypothetical protein
LKLVDNKYPVNCFEMLLSYLDPEDITAMKFFSGEGVRVKVQKESDAAGSAALLGAENHKMAVILDWKCEGSFRFLAEVRKPY